MKYLLSANLYYTRGKKTKRLGQYNSNNKLIHGQYTSRYSLYLSLSVCLSLIHAHTHTERISINIVLKFILQKDCYLIFLMGLSQAETDVRGVYVKQSQLCFVPRECL